MCGSRTPSRINPRSVYGQHSRKRRSWDAAYVEPTYAHLSVDLARGWVRAKKLLEIKGWRGGAMAKGADHTTQGKTTAEAGYPSGIAV